jgi:hypothetical protein
MKRTSSKCVMSPKHTVIAMGLWLLLPASLITWLFSIVGLDPRLLYLAGVTLLPASLTLLAPWLRAWLDIRKDVITQPVLQVPVSGTPYAARLTSAQAVLVQDVPEDWARSLNESHLRQPE